MTETERTLPFTVSAYAKVNLGLYVGAVRADGLHQIASLFQQVSLADRITFRVAAGLEDLVRCERINEGDNLVTKALKLYRARSGWRELPLEISIEKKIPIGAGLGGGSSDAAETLRAANTISGGLLTDEELSSVGFEVGADVPFFLSASTALVTGAGEVVRPLAPVGGYSLLLVPGSGLSAAEVYRAFDGQGNAANDLNSNIEAIESIETVAGLAVLENQLEEAVLSLRPDVGDTLEAVKTSGALAARVTGSGPSVFGLFKRDGDAIDAASELKALGAIHVEVIS